jgi:hypothetical protein
MCSTAFVIAIHLSHTAYTHVGIKKINKQFIFIIINMIITVDVLFQDQKKSRKHVKMLKFETFHL